MRTGLLLLLGLALAGPARANGVYLPNGNGHTHPIAFEGLSGYTQLELRGSREKADDYELNETLFAPGLHLATDGSIYHRRLLHFHLEGGISLQQRKLSGTVEGTDRFAFDDHVVSLQLLGERRLSLAAFSRRDHAWIESPYRSSYRLTSSRYGVELSGKRLAVPFTMGWSAGRRSEELGSGDQITDRSELRASAQHQAGPSRTDLSLRMESYDRTLQSIEYSSLSADLRNTLQGRGRSLRTGARWLHQYGDLSRSDVQWSEDGTAWLGEHLEGGLQLQHYRRRSARAEGALGRPLQISTSGSAQLRHTLYGSLESTLRVYGQNESSYEERAEGRQEVADLARRGALLSLDYRRSTAWGRIRLGAGYDLGREDQTAQDRLRTVSNEEHVLQDGSEPTLENIGVDETTIVVTDLSGFVVYVEDVDYQVVTLGSFTRLFRLPAGDIPDGESILVDYRYLTSPDLSFDIRRTQAHAGWDLPNKLSLDYRYQRNEEDLVSGQANGFLQDQRRHRMGLRWGGRVLGLREEYEINRLTASEFRSNRVQLDAGIRPSPRTRLQLGASHTWTRYEEIDQSLQYWMLSARAQATAAGGLHLEAQSWLRMERGDASHSQLDSDIWGLRLKASRRLRLLQVEAGFFLRDADDNGVSDGRRSFHLTLRRDF